MDQKYIIFGCGEKGRELYRFLGKENIYGFMDNNPNVITPDGTKLLSLDESIPKNCCVIIAAMKEHAREIVFQLVGAGINNFISWDEFGFATDFKDPRDYEILRNVKKELFLEGNRKKSSDSEVEFYLVDAFEIYHFLPFYLAFMEAGIRCSFVAEPGCINTAGEWFDFLTAVETLDQYGVSYTMKANRSAKIAFTTQFSRNLSKYPKAKKFQLSYGNATCISKAFQYDPEVIKEFDYHLVHGVYQKDLIGKYCDHNKIIEIGYPKYINFFEKAPSKAEIKEKLGIKTDKPILVYLPTWDEYSSIQKYGDEINQLRESFYVISKPHHCTARLPEKRDDMEKLRRTSDLVLDGNSDLSDVAVLSDFAVCDAKSGVIGDIAYLNQNLKMCIIYANGLTPNDLYPGFANAYCGINRPEDMISSILQTFKHDDYINIRREFVDKLYYKDSKAGVNKVVEVVKTILRK